MPEERGLYKKMKLGELLQFHGELNDGKDLKQRIDYWLNRLDLEEFRDKKVETLSKGMKQKLQFIATIIHKPEIIILDEPFSGLDPVNADIMKDVILGLQKEGSTIIFSTHDMGMAMIPSGSNLKWELKHSKVWQESKRSTTLENCRNSGLPQEPILRRFCPKCLKKHASHDLK
ncbi:MAG: ATP-binding cassette domain-containing protein [Bacteroidales bacterium]|nr:ATP-binding cassette domain-containing protein [Bacteroidales bacterium]